MPGPDPGTGLAIAARALVGGLVLLARGLAAWRRGHRVAIVAAIALVVLRGGLPG